MNEINYANVHLQTYSVLPHSHETWEFIYCTSGSGTFHFAENKIDYKQGDIVIIPPNVMHANESSKGFTNVHINMEDVSLPQHPDLISDDSEKHILTSFKDAFYYYNSQTHKKQLLLSALGNLIVSYIIAFQRNKPLPTVVDEIKSNIVKNFPDCNYQLDDYLHSFNFSYDYLRKLFKSEMGITPYRYLLNMRMQLAEKLLCSLNGNEYNITQIAHMCGFDEPLYFSRVFKKEFKCSPINYAKQKQHPQNNL